MSRRICVELYREIVALRQQLAMFKSRGRQPRIRPADRAFWVVLRQLWSRWTEALVTVKPETAIFTSATRQSRPVCRDLAARPLRVRPCRAMPIGGDSR